jgi:hypothetical protein
MKKRVARRRCFTKTAHFCAGQTKRLLRIFVVKIIGKFLVQITYIKIRFRDPSHDFKISKIHRKCQKGSAEEYQVNNPDPKQIKIHIIKTRTKQYQR